MPGDVLYEGWKSLLPIVVAVPAAGLVLLLLAGRFSRRRKLARIAGAAMLAVGCVLACWACLRPWYALHNGLAHEVASAAYIDAAARQVIVGPLHFSDPGGAITAASARLAPQEHLRVHVWYLGDIYTPEVLKVAMEP